MLSRIADALYRMARYLERVDDTARLIELALLHFLEADDEVSAETHWRPLLEIGDAVAAYEAVNPDGRVTQDRVIRFLTLDRSHPSGIRGCLRLARDDARAVRDRISREMWTIVNELGRRAESQLDRADGPETMVALCRMVRGEIARFHGVAAGTMLRGEAFGFYRLGTFVERADMTARILAAKQDVLAGAASGGGSALDAYHGAALLKAVSGFEAYRRTHAATFDPTAVAAFVVGAAGFPRSLRFAVDRIGEALAMADVPSPAAADVARALAADVAAPVGELRPFLLHVTARLGALDAALRDDLFYAATDAPPPAAVAAAVAHHHQQQ